MSCEESIVRSFKRVHKKESGGGRRGRLEIVVLGKTTDKT